MKRTIALLSLLALLQKPVVAKEVKPAYQPLTVADMVDIINDYQIYHMSVPPTFDQLGGWSMYYGVTDFSARSIGINKMLTRPVKRLTGLHEARHTVYDKLGIPQREDWVRDYACRDYELFFKEKCPDQNDLEKSLRWEYR